MDPFRIGPDGAAEKPRNKQRPEHSGGLESIGAQEREMRVVTESEDPE